MDHPCSRRGSAHWPFHIVKPRRETYNSTIAIQTHTFLPTFTAFTLSQRKRNIHHRYFSHLYNSHPDRRLNTIAINGHLLQQRPKPQSQSLEHLHGVHRHQPCPTAARTSKTTATRRRGIRATMGFHRGRAAASAIDSGGHAGRGGADAEAQGRQLHTSSGHDAQATANHAQHCCCLLQPLPDAQQFEAPAGLQAASPLREYFL